jgi:hypothetical protein
VAFIGVVDDGDRVLPDRIADAIDAADQNEPAGRSE